MLDDSILVDYFPNRIRLYLDEPSEVTNGIQVRKLFLSFDEQEKYTREWKREEKQSDREKQSNLKLGKNTQRERVCIFFRNSKNRNEFSFSLHTNSSLTITHTQSNEQNTNEIEGKTVGPIFFH